MAITYIHQPNAATVKLDGKVVGKIAHTTDNGGGWTYWPKGWKEHGEVFPTVDEVKRSLESDEEPRTRQDTYAQLHALNRAELATVLAALRYWQREGLMSAGCEQDIASDGGRIEPLTQGQIDELCERLNCGGDAADSSPKKPRLTQHDLAGGSCISASVTTDGELTTIVMDNRDASNLALKLSGGRITNRDDREALAKLGRIIGSAI